jgi:hypothetical protein
MKRIIGWIPLGILAALYILSILVDEGWGGLWWLPPLLAWLVGLFVGGLLMRGAYRRFGWEESTLRSVGWGVGIGGAIIWLVLDFVLGALGVPPFASGVMLAILVGAVARAIAIRKQLRSAPPPREERF